MVEHRTLAPGEETTVDGVLITASRVPELTFERLAKTSINRVGKIHAHGLESWSLSDWMVACQGELGEAANIVKKLNRIRDGMPSNMNRMGKAPRTVEDLMGDLEEECADAAIYLILFCARAGINLPRAIVWKFNRVSKELGVDDEL